MLKKKKLIAPLLLFCAAVCVGFVSAPGEADRQVLQRGKLIAVFQSVLQALGPLLQDSSNDGTAVSFTDVEFWPESPGFTMVSGGLMKGFPDGSFRPDTSVTRGEAIDLFARFQSWLNHRLASPQEWFEPAVAFADIPPGHWLSPALKKLAGTGALEGFDGKRLEPDLPCSLETARQMARALVDYFRHDEIVARVAGNRLEILTKGSVMPLTRRDFSWSFDGKRWKPLPENGEISRDAAALSPANSLFLQHDSYYQVLIPLPVTERETLNFAHLQRRSTPQRNVLVQTQEFMQRNGNPLAKAQATVPAPRRTVVPRREVALPAEESMESYVETIEEKELVPEKNEIRSAARQPPTMMKTEVAGIRGRVQKSSSPEPLAGATVLVGESLAVTDEAGEFVIASPAHGIQDFTVYKEGFETLFLRRRINDSTQNLEFRLNEKSGTLEGRILDPATGRGIPGATVRLDRRLVRADAAGKFCLAAVAPTYQQLTFSAPGYRDSMEIVLVPAGSEKRDIFLTPLEAPTAE
jgi:hypothetical protein